MGTTGVMLLASDLLPYSTHFRAILVSGGWERWQRQIKMFKVNVGVSELAKYEVIRLRAPTQTSKNKQKLSEPTLSEFWKTLKVYSNQVKFESGKRQHQLVGRLCGTSTCPHPTPTVAQWQSGRCQPTFPLWTGGLWFCSEQSKPYLQLILYVCFVWDHLKDRRKTFIYFI